MICCVHLDKLERWQANRTGYKSEIFIFYKFIFNILLYRVNAGGVRLYEDSCPPGAAESCEGTPLFKTFFNNTCDTYGIGELRSGYSINM